MQEVCRAGDKGLQSCLQPLSPGDPALAFLLPELFSAAGWFVCLFIMFLKMVTQ